MRAAGFLNPRTEKEIPAAGIGLAENAHRFRIEAVGIDLEFESVIYI